MSARQYAPVTTQVVDAVVERRRAGARDYQIARDLGVNSTALSRHLSSLGLGQHQVGRTPTPVVERPVEVAPKPRPGKPPPPPKAAKPEKRARVLDLEARHLADIRRLAPALTASEIASWLEISREDVRLVAARNGIDLMSRRLKQRAES